MITSRNFWYWFGGIWLFVGGLFLMVCVPIGVHRMRVNDRLEKEGRTVEGMVLSKETYRTSSRSGSRSSPSYHVTFRFDPPQGEPVLGIADVTKETWDALEERGPIHVTYLADEPQSHRVAGERKGAVLLLVFGGLGGMFGSIGGFIVFNTFRKRKREK